MRIAVTATGRDPGSLMDARFGRAALFLVYDTETNAWDVLDNADNRDAAHGAGIVAAETVARSGATVLLTGQCGPKAMDALQRAGVRVVAGEEGTAEQAVQRFLAA